MSAFYTQLSEFIASHFEQTIQELSALCAQPSIAATGVGMTACAQLVAALLRARGFTVKIIPTAGHPVVLGQVLGKNSERTLLLYNHYDVQPPDPLDLWLSPPFEPTIRDGVLYARGANDDKGNLSARLAALDAVREAHGGQYPCNITFLIEGEEEIGSPNLADFVAQHAALLQAQACIWEFGGVDHNDTPLLWLGLRGICYVELSVQTAHHDAHSGVGGSIFPNAAWRLVWALSSLKDVHEQIQIAGHLDAVQAPSAVDLTMLQLAPDSRMRYQALYGITDFLGGGQQSAAELWRRELFEPTCTICGLNAGYHGQGPKTVLPARARAKVDFRLVPNQTVAATLSHLRRHLDQHGFGDIEVTLICGEEPARTDPQHPFVRQTLAAARAAYGCEPLAMPLSGVSGPNYIFQHHLGVPIVTVGCSHPSAQVHAPNENVRLDLLQAAIRHLAYLIHDFATATET
jgi:acetylornithine deacetylase/succinyl-diaminopimelate desuccinylase-like protein